MGIVHDDCGVDVGTETVLLGVRIFSQQNNGHHLIICGDGFDHHHLDLDKSKFSYNTLSWQNVFSNRIDLCGCWMTCGRMDSDLSPQMIPNKSKSNVVAI